MSSQTYPEIMVCQLSGYPSAQSSWHLKLTVTGDARGVTEGSSRVFRRLKHYKEVQKVRAEQWLLALTWEWKASLCTTAQCLGDITEPGRPYSLAVLGEWAFWLTNVFTYGDGPSTFYFSILIGKTLSFYNKYVYFSACPKCANYGNPTCW